jgi:tight adherence protein B
MLETLVFLLVMFPVLYLAHVAQRVLRGAYARYRDRYVAKSMTDLSGMFLFVDSQQLLLLTFAATGLFGLTAWALGNGFLGALGALVGLCVPSLLVRFYRTRRLKKLEAQLLDALPMMASALRAGLTLHMAMEQIAKDAAAPLSQEFGLFIKEVKLGVSFEEALLNMARAVGSEDLDLVVTSANIARQLGGNMAEMFETIAATLRERFRLEGKIRSLTAQGKMQGWIVACLPLALGLTINIMRPDLMQPMLGHPFSVVLVVTIVLMEALGIFLIRRIVRIDV